MHFKNKTLGKLKTHKTEKKNKIITSTYYSKHSYLLCSKQVLEIKKKTKVCSF